MISVRQKGDYKTVSSWLSRLVKIDIRSVLEKYGQKGVELLSAATPKDTGLTAGSWSYDLEVGNGLSRITFSNSNVNHYVNIAIILQTGHGTGTGGWVEGIDYINPAMEETFKGLADEAWREVTSLS